MNSLVEKRILSKIDYGSYFAYLLNEENSFSSTEFKVMKSQLENYLVNCMRVHYNGRIELLFFSKELKPLSALLLSSFSENLTDILSSILEDIFAVKYNGFLDCKNIDMSLEHIYVNPDTYKTKLVYIPLRYHIYDDDYIMESSLRNMFAHLIAGMKNLPYELSVNLQADLKNRSLSLESIYTGLTGSKPVIEQFSSPSVKPDFYASNKLSADSDFPLGKVKLIALNSPVKFELIIGKNKFIIGKKEGQVDGYIPFNDKISRLHCRIDAIEKNYYITDLQSSNGTYVNYGKILPNKPFEIRDNDIIRLADSDFEVSIR